MAGIEKTNERADKIWSFVDQSVDFDGRLVLDLGCGYGDFMSKSLESDALFVLGVDRDYIIASWADARMQADEHDTSDYAISVADINDVVREGSEEYLGFDIIICFSVLPYLEHQYEVLTWIKNNSDIALIECQYAGDGPGPQFIKDDDDMERELRAYGWKHVENIGWTDVMIRPAKRTIWKCYD